MARARLRDRHQETLQKKLAKLKQEQLGGDGDGVKTEVKREPPEEEPEQDPANLPSASSAVDPSTAPSMESEQRDSNSPLASTSNVFLQPSVNPKVSEENEPENWPDDDEDLTEDEKRHRQYTVGRYSPVLVQEHTLPPGTEIVDALEDSTRVDFARRQFRKSGTATSQKDAALEAEAKKGMGGDESAFAVEAPLEHKVYLWSDKYRPRKPRYFNRVHTGFEWNKYNQTHYDLDNPPPKIVQGYKFNIFYPDLLDPSTPPEFVLIPEDDPDFAILKFHAGPPYEDIAFRVVYREWEISHKRGYRCQFQNGIFQLWFHFRKLRYRR